MPEKLTYPTEDVKLENGGSVLWSRLYRKERAGWTVPTLCSKPEHGEREVRACDAIKPEFSGRCPTCYVQNLPYKLTGILMLPKGSKVLYDVRSSDGYRRVAFECRGCFQKTGELKYVELSYVSHYIKG
jgi:hypothetical protein